MIYDYDVDEMHYIVHSIMYRLFKKRKLMKKYNIGDCFLDNRKGKHIIIITSILEDFCSVKFLGINQTYSFPLYRLEKLTRLGNVYQDEVLKILFQK